MLTVSGVCTCNRCEQHGMREIYRMVGSCWNCKAEPVLMLFRAGERAEVLKCPTCKVKAVHAKRLATDDEIPAAEATPCVSCGREPGTYENYRGQLLCTGCATAAAPSGDGPSAQPVAELGGPS
jgi:hypothetical protein